MCLTDHTLVGVQFKLFVSESNFGVGLHVGGCCECEGGRADGNDTTGQSVARQFEVEFCNIFGRRVQLVEV